MSILFLAAVAAVLTQASAQPFGQLRIVATPPAGANCATRIAVFNGEAAYAARMPYAQAVLSPPASVVMFELPQGEYAAVAWCDLDGNGLLDRDADGRPTEPFALSGVDELRGPPSFSDLRVELEDAAELVLKLR